MRVLMLTSSYPKFSGDGTAPFIERIALAVARRGHAVDLVLPRHPELVTAGRAGDLPIRFFPFVAGPPRPHVWGYATSMQADRRLRGAALLVAPIAFLSALATLRRLAAHERYDLVHAHWMLPNGPIAALAAAAADLPLVVSLHGSDVFVAERSRWLRGVARRVLAGARAVVACSRDLAERAMRIAPGIDCNVIPYGVDVEDLSGSNAAAWRERAGAGAADFLVVGLGRLVAKKGFSDLIRAAGRLRDRGLSIRVAIGGGGDLEPELRAQASEAGIGGGVRLLGDVPHDEVGALLAAADAVAVPSVRDERGNVDGLPNVLLEALAAGRPVVATRIAGIPDVVEDGRNGILVPAGDPAALADALGHVAADRGLRERLGAEAKRSAGALSWPTHGERLLAVYERAVGDEPSR